MARRVKVHLLYFHLARSLCEPADVVLDLRQQPLLPLTPSLSEDDASSLEVDLSLSEVESRAETRLAFEFELELLYSHPCYVLCLNALR